MSDKYDVLEQVLRQVADLCAERDQLRAEVKRLRAVVDWLIERLAEAQGWGSNDVVQIMKEEGMWPAQLEGK